MENNKASAVTYKVEHTLGWLQLTTTKFSRKQFEKKKGKVCCHVPILWQMTRCLLLEEAFEEGKPPTTLIKQMKGLCDVGGLCLTTQWCFRIREHDACIFFAQSVRWSVTPPLPSKIQKKKASIQYLRADCRYKRKTVHFPPPFFFVLASC